MRDRRFGGDGFPARTRDRAYSPPRRPRDRDYSAPRKIRDYTPPRPRRDRDRSGRIRDSPPMRTRDPKYSSPPRKYHSPPVRSRNHEYLPPGRRTRNREISPPPRTRTGNWEQRSPRGRSREQHSPHGRRTRDHQLSPTGQPIGELRGEYFHELERSRRMGMDGGGDFGDFQNSQPLSYVGGDREYGLSQSLRNPDRGRGNDDMFAEHSQRLHGIKEGLGDEDSTSVKYPWSHLLDEPRKFDTVKGSSDYGMRVSSDRENHGRPYSGLVEGSLSSEADKRRLYPSYESHLTDVGVQPRFSGMGNSGGYSMQSRYLDADHLKGEEIHSQDDRHHSRKAGGGPPVSRDLCTEDSLKSMRYSEFSSDYTGQPSHSNVLPLAPGVIKDDVSSSYTKDVQIRSHRGRLNSGKTIESVDHDGYDKNLGTVSSHNPEKQVSGFRNYSGSYLGQTDERRETFSYSDLHRGEVGSPNTLPSEFYGKRAGSGEAHFQDVARPNVGLGRFDEFSHRETLVEDKPWGSLLSAQRRSTPDYFESRRALDQRKPDEDILNYGDNRHPYELETHRGYDSSRKRELPEYQMDGDLLERSNAFYREHAPRLEKIDPRPYERFISRDLAGPSNLSLREKHRTTDNHGAGITISSDVRSAEKVHGRGDADELWISRNTDSVVMSRRLNVPRSKYGKNGRAYKATATNSSTRNLSVSISSRSSKFSISGGRDIKKRLGPRYQNLDTEQPLGKNSKPPLKKRLGPRLGKNHAPPPWVKKFNSHKFSRTQDCLDESVAEQGDDPNEGTITPAKTEPPENSKDFRKLVQNAFFKFVRHLNETPAKRRKYSEQAGSLKCLVCGSDSEEFVDSEKLMLHALESPKAGLRSQHLGLHKALCALMGWKSADAPNTGWVCEMLSNAETMALKEDLIIWPPVVVIHNSSIMNNDPDQRVAVSAEELESKLRDMGFGEKAKISRGKPANQSILVVKFSATLSGLQEAERLCDIYAHRKHGRAEFQRINRGQSGSSDGETSKEPLTDKIGNILYGYLGVAEDLDKLDFETKKRSAVRSKKQIKDIAVAP